MDARRLPGGMRVLALFSGGKDSTLAAHVAAQAGWDVRALVTLDVGAADSLMFHRPNVRWTPLLAEALGLPHVLGASDGEPDAELDDLEATLRRAAALHGPVEGVVSGAVASEYQRTRIERVTARLGLKSFAPLWHKEPAALLRHLVEARYDVRFAHAAAEGLDESWLGRRLDASALADLDRAARRHGLHVGGEGGEYETVTLDGPFFRRRVDVVRATSSWKRDAGSWTIGEARLAPRDG